MLQASWIYLISILIGMLVGQAEVISLILYSKIVPASQQQWFSRNSKYTGKNGRMAFGTWFLSATLTPLPVFFRIRYCR